jgi:diguanylate cyclase (GGDEF)-like protein/PAS domain S-box-containing protein
VEPVITSDPTQKRRAASKRIKGGSSPSLGADSVASDPQPSTSQSASCPNETQFDIPSPREDPRWLRAIVESGGDSIVAVTPDGLIVMWNAGAEHVYGYRADEAMGRHISLLDPPSSPGETTVNLHRALAGEQVRSYEAHRMRKDGEEVAVSLIVSPVPDESGTPIGVCSIARDLSPEHEALLRSEERFRALVQESADLILVADAELRLVYASPAATRIFGFDPADEQGRNLLEFVHRDDADRVASQFVGHARHPGTIGAAIEYRVRRSDGEWRTIESISTNLLDDPAIRGVVVNARDITELRQAQQKLVRREAWLDAILTNAFDLMVAVDAEGKVTFTTPATREFLGTTSPGAVDLDMFSYGHPADLEALRDAFVRIVNGTQMREALQCRVRSGNGTYRWLEMTGTNMLDDPVVNAIVLHGHDVTERHLAQEKIAHQAGHDALTGLPNRHLLSDRIRQALARARRDGSNMAVFFMDLDDFKRINDLRGHSLGDIVLREVADRLKASSRESDTVARFGGDEFVLVIEQVNDGDEARQIAERTLSKVFDEPFVAGQRAVHLAASMGVALGKGTASPERLLADADTAMYVAKRSGRSRVEVFDRMMRSAVATHVENEESLRQALANDELTAYFQPVVSLEDGSVVGAEALVRWLHPVQGAIPAAAFVHLAEVTGMIEPISSLVFEQACEELRRVRDCWPDLDFTMSVNVSPQQLRDSRTVPLLAIAERAGVDPRRLVVEVTESSLLEEDSAMLEWMRELRQAGVRVAADDFGTGYSSLSYLKRLPIDILKIDRMFVDGLGQDPLDTAVVDAIIGMASALGLEVIAEGVETAGQRSELLARGVHRAQGFLFSRALPAEDFEEEVSRTAAAGATMG